MKKISPSELKDLYLKLPSDLKEVYFSANLTKVIQLLAKKYNLQIDKEGILADEIGYVLIGATHPNDFIPNLARRLGVDKTKAREIAMDVNEQIFKKVRDSLRKIHNIRDEEEELEEEKKQESFGPPENKNDILKEIEKEDVAVYAPLPVKTRPIVPVPVAPALPETKDIAASAEGEKIPDIFKGVTNPFEAKLKNEMYVAPKEEIKREIEKEIPSAGNTYGESDPYREPIE